MTILILLGNCPARANTNAPPSLPLILKGHADTNSAAQRWSPWSCWWLMPHSNAPVRSDLSNGDIGETAASNQLAQASTSGSNITNTTAELTQTNAEVSPNDRDLIDFGARIASGGPIGHRNVEIGQQTLTIGKATALLGPNNTLLGQGQISGPTLVSPAPTGSIGKPAGGAGQSPAISPRTSP
jgi:hypothetical protein